MSLFAHPADLLENNAHPIFNVGDEIICPAKYEVNQAPLLPSRLPKYDGQMTVVLDMDETLVHSTFLADLQDQLEQSGEQYLVNDNGELEIIRQHKEKADYLLHACGGIAVGLRPGLHSFLKKLSENFEVVLFTAAERDYAEPLLNLIDPGGTLLPYRLFREHTVQFQGTLYVKDLSLLGRDLKRTVLVDNNIMTMRASPNNCVLIEDFYGDPNDRQLEVMWDILEELSDLPDIRPCLIESGAIARRIDAIMASNCAVQQPTGRNGSHFYVEMAPSFQIGSQLGNSMLYPQPFQKYYHETQDEYVYQDKIYQDIRCQNYFNNQQYQEYPVYESPFGHAWPYEER